MVKILYHAAACALDPGAPLSEGNYNILFWQYIIIPFELLIQRTVYFFKARDLHCF